MIAASANMVCNPTVAGKPIRHVESFKAGTARLSMVLPKTAKGRQLTIKIAISLSGRTSTRAFTYKVR